jgi:hypothetical protein
MLLTNRPIFAIVSGLSRCPFPEDTSGLTIPIFGKENHPMRERQKELSRRRKRKEETLRARRKTAKMDAAAKKGK